MRNLRDLNLFAACLAGLMLIGPGLPSSAKAGSSKTEIETTRELCSETCAYFPAGTCETRFHPYEVNGSYGQCQTFVLDNSAPTAAPADSTTATAPDNSTANQRSTGNGSGTSTGGLSDWLSEESDADYNRRINEGLVGRPAPNASSSGGDLYGQ